MAEKVLQFDEKALLGELTNLEKVLLPRASYISLNRAVFDARVRLQDEAKNRFRTVSSFTLSQFKYEKPVSKGNTLIASVFITSRINKGNAPARYLAPQIYGGSAYRTRIQRALDRSPSNLRNDSTPILSHDKIMVPVMKVSPQRYSKIANQLRGLSKPPTGRYFYFSEKLQRAAAKNNKKVLPLGIYFRKNKRGKIQLILKEIDTPSYTGKFDFFKYAVDEINRSFKKNLLEQLKRK